MHSDAPCLGNARQQPIKQPTTTELTTLTTAALARWCSVEAPQDRQGAPVGKCPDLELFRRAIEQRDERAWELVYQQWRGVLLHWLHQHPAARLALEYGPPESYVTAALSKFWQATQHPNRSSPTFSTLAGILAYLRCCLNSALLDAARQSCTRQQRICAAGVAEEVVSQPAEAAGDDLWRSIERALPRRRERLLVYLRYVQGERPRELVATYPQAFPSVEDVYRLERSILERLRRHPALAPWKD